MTSDPPGGLPLAEGEWIVYATPGRGSMRSTRTFLDDHTIPCRGVDLDREAEAEGRLRRLPRGRRRVPMPACADGSTRVGPGPLLLARKFGLDA